MKNFVRVGLVALAVPTFVLAYVACSSDEPSGGTSPSSTTTSTSPTGTTTSTGTPDGTAPDSAVPDASACTYPKPEVDGGQACGAHPFGQATVVLADAGAAFELDGSVGIPPGIYDLTSGERSTGIPYGWRETLVLDGAKYSQIRQLEPRQGNPSAATTRSGAYTVSGGKLTLDADCARSEDGGVIDAGGAGTPFSYEVVNDGCKVKLRLIAAGALLTYTRR